MSEQFNESDFETLSNDVEGFWSSEGSIIFRPTHCHLSDNGADKTKPSILIIGQLLAPCENLYQDKEPIKLEVGATVGVWYQAGMRPILNCGGLPTRVTRNPEKDKKLEGRPKPMKGYDVDTPKARRGQQLTVLEDSRRQSKGAATPFDKN